MHEACSNHFYSKQQLYLSHESLTLRQGFKKTGHYPFPCAFAFELYIAI